MTTTNGRLHALDNLRALMMWLGIVLHASAIYMLRNNPLPWADDKRTPVAELLVAFIHAFRMPVFFLLAGFFVAMLLQGRGPAGMARHRVMRLGIPFAVFWIPLVVATVVFALLFIHQMERGTWGLDMSLMAARIRKSGAPVVPEAPNTMHMWFLWMLLWMSLATAVLARYVPPQVWNAPARWLRRAAAAWWGPIALALPLVLTDASYAKGFMFPSGLFVPPAAEWVHWGLFYALGIATYAVRDELFATWLRRRSALAAAGFVTFLASGACEQAGLAVAFAFFYGLTSWLWSFALVGIALKWMPMRNPVLGYLADASYWVYLVHMPLTVGFGALLYLADLPALVKLAINIAATTAVCLASYQLLVRFTWVSVMLNGKRHTRAPLAATAAA